MLPLTPLLLLTLTQASIIATAPAIKWVDCKTHVPVVAGFDVSAIDLSHLPTTLHCGQLDVPLDYSQPLGRNNSVTLGIAMYRPCEPRGVVFYNPGGSDAGAVVAWQVALNQTGEFDGLLDYDLMVLDVRGTYSSNQLDFDITTFSGLGVPYPTNQSEFEAFHNASAQFIQSWIDHSSPPGILAHVGTKQVVQDYEQVRQALKYEKINFIGASYGSFRAHQYAATFPEHVGNFVLDALAPHGRSLFDQAHDSIAAANRALLRADAYCQNDMNCVFRSQGKGIVPKVFKQLLTSAQKSPLVACLNSSTLSCVPAIGPFDLQMGLYGALMGNPDFPGLIDGLAAALTGNASFLLSPPPTLAELVSVPLLCNDYYIEDNTFAGFQKSYKNAEMVDSAMIGVSQTWQIQLFCKAWPFHTPKSRPLPTNATMLLVTADFDASAPTEWTTETWSQTPNSGLIVRHGDGHVSFQSPARSSSILSKAFLRSGVLPKASRGDVITVYAPGGVRDEVGDPYLFLGGGEE